MATDHVIESFRNELWPGYKTGEGIDPDLRSQFWPLEDALTAMGVVVWAMVDVEADDALASAAAVAADDPAVEQVVICTPDKDLGQCVRGTRVVQLDRRRDHLIDEDGVIEKFGVSPASIPDYLALVGDSADGFPGLAGWGAKSASAVLARWAASRTSPRTPTPGRSRCVARPSLRPPCATTVPTRCCSRELALLRVDRTLLPSVGDLRWTGPTEDFTEICRDLDAIPLSKRVQALALERS